jgi:hypothetical protein
LYAFELSVVGVNPGVERFLASGGFLVCAMQSLEQQVLEFLQHSPYERFRLTKWLVQPQVAMNRANETRLPFLMFRYVCHALDNRARELHLVHGNSE